MILVKIKDGVVVKFPYTIDDLRADNPTVSFPSEPSNDILKDHSTAQVFYYPYPIFDKDTQYVKVSQEPILIDGVWSMHHEVVDKTPEEIATFNAAALKAYKTKLLNQIDEKTSHLITYSCVYLGRKVRLNSEDQNNFEGAFTMIKDYLADGVPSQYIFPYVFKIWTNEITDVPEFISFTNLNEMKNFVYSCKIFIQACLARGWEIKTGLNGLTLNQLTAWIDPRP